MENGELRAAVGRRIRMARERKGWRQKDLGRRIRVEAQIVSNWERGRNLPALDMFPLLARELGVTVPWLFSGERDPEDVRAEVQADLARAYREVAARLARIEEALGLPPVDQDEPPAPAAENGA